MCHFKCWKYCLQIKGKVAKLSWRGDSPKTPKLYLRQTKLVCQRLAWLRFFPICNIFPIIDQCRFFYFRDRPDVLMKVFEDYIIFLIWADWVLLNFYLKQLNKGFQSGALLKMPPLSTLVNNKNTLKKCRSQLGNFKYKKAICFTGYS